MTSTPLTVLTVAAVSGLACLLLAGISYAGMPVSGSDPRRGPAVAVAGGMLGWAALVFVLAAEGSFEVGADTTVPAIALAVVLPVALGWSLLAVDPFRRLLQRMPVQQLIGVQFYRIAGALFLVAYLQDHMPGEFALPAGIGDVLVGLTAPAVAYSLARGARRARPAALIWNALGMADLVVAVTLGILSSPSVFQQLALDAPNEAITQWPFVLVPAFAVPVSMLLHIFALTRLRSQRSA